MFGLPVALRIEIVRSRSQTGGGWEFPVFRFFPRISYSEAQNLNTTPTVTTEVPAPVVTTPTVTETTTTTETTPMTSSVTEQTTTTTTTETTHKRMRKD